MDANAAYTAPPGEVGPRTNTMALVSLIVGIVTWVLGIVLACPLLFTGVGGLICCPITLIGSAAAMVTGFLGRNQIRASMGQQKGEGLGIVGLILGGLGVLASLLFLCVAILAVAKIATLPNLPGILTPSP